MNSEENKYNQVITDFLTALDKRVVNKKLIVQKSIEIYDLKKTDCLPDYLLSSLERLDGLRIISNERDILFSCSDCIQENSDYLLFAYIDKNIRIAFDLNHKNEAGEWNIINPDNDHVITKTFASFLTNKVWAWIDRGRKIWSEEIY